jgi:hypothetical protein
MLGLHYSLSTKSHAVMQVAWGSARLYLITILSSGSCCLLDVLEESYFSLFGKSLDKQLMKIIKENGRIDHYEKLPDDIRKSLKNYQAELTQTNKRELELVTVGLKSEK